MHFTIKRKRKERAGREKGEGGRGGRGEKRPRERTGLREAQNVEAERTSENRGIATSVINGILSSLHVKLG